MLFVEDLKVQVSSSLSRPWSLLEFDAFLITWFNLVLTCAEHDVVSLLAIFVTNTKKQLVQVCSDFIHCPMQYVSKYHCNQSLKQQNEIFFKHNRTAGHETHCVFYAVLGIYKEVKVTYMIT